MKKYVVIPDSFKGTLTSVRVCTAVREEILAADPSARVVTIPVADGGEGSVSAFLAALGGEWVSCACHGPWMEELTAAYGLLPDGRTAVVEMAAAAGLPLAGRRRDPLRTTTFGVGELMAHALDHGAEQLILGLGGSATNDGGCGAAAALGVRFLDDRGRAFVPVGGTLERIAHIDLTGRHPGLAGAVRVMCDIDNPLCGPDGASAVFGPQKGADPAAVHTLDTGLFHLAEVIRRDLGREVLTLPGGGAAGGFGAGAAALLDGTLERGIETVLDVTDFDRRAAGADLILTGEGRLDSQSLGGKVVVGVARRAKALGIPAAALVGSADADLNAFFAQGLSGVFPINPVPGTLETLAPRAEENLRFTVRSLMHFLMALDR